MSHPGPTLPFGSDGGPPPGPAFGTSSIPPPVTGAGPVAVTRADA